ncbi:MAG: NAD-dependent epimerase/dehydratase family protein [Pseudomonadales bacterium]
MQTILLTGSDGFIGRHAAPALLAAGFTVKESALRAEHFSVDQCMAELQGVDAVVNLVGLAHSSPKQVQENDYLQVNAEFPARLGACALAAGVKRFVHVSSVKGARYQASLAPNDELNAARPKDIYGLSKRLGEEKLLAHDWHSSQCVVLRPSLVYGAGVKANMKSLLSVSRSRFCPILVDTGSRSMLNINNFCSALTCSLIAKELNHSVYIITDSTALTVADIQNAARKETMGERASWQVSATTVCKILGVLKVFPDAWFRSLFDVLAKITEAELYTASRFEQEFNWTAKHALEDVIPDMLAEL